MHPPCVAVAPKRRATSLLPKSSHQPTHSSAARRLGGGCGSDPSTGGLEVGTQGRFSCLLSSPTKPRRRQPHVLGSLEPSKLAQRIRRGNAGALDVDRECRYYSGYTEARVDGSMSRSASPVPKPCPIRLRQPLRGKVSDVSRSVSWRRHVAEVCVSPAVSDDVGGLAGAAGAAGAALADRFPGSTDLSCVGMGCRRL